MFTKTQISNALGRGVSWLLQQQQSDGSWRADFGFRHGAASSWSTAYVANRLPAEAISKKKSGLAFDFVMGRLLASSRHTVDSLGYNDGTPPDLDTTIEALRLLNKHDCELVSPRQFLPLIRLDGGLPTYTEANARSVLPAGVSPMGWTSSHLEIACHALQWLEQVNTNTPGAAELRELLASFIRQHIAVKGYECYWFHHPVVALTWILRAKVARDSLPEPPLSTRVKELDWETRHNPFVAAHALEAAIRWGTGRYHNTIKRLVTDLLLSQRSDGSWRPCHVLRVPYPDETNPRIVQHTNADYRCPIITVAAVVAALTLLLKTT